MGATTGIVDSSYIDWLRNEQQERLNNYQFYTRYYNGEHDVNIPKAVEAALASELGTILNYCRIVVDNPVDYIAGGRITVEVPTDTEAETFLNDLYDDNGLLGAEMMKLLTILGKKGDVFLKLFIEKSQIKVNVLRPDLCFPRYETDNYRKLRYCVVQWWESTGEPDGTVEPNDPETGIWHAQVFWPDRVDEYILVAKIDSEKTNWDFVLSRENELGFIPIIHIKNTIDDMEFGYSDLQVMTDLQDALNKTITDMMLAMDQQAFQRPFLFGSQSPKGTVLSTAPGIITEVLDAQGHLDIVPPAEVNPFVVALDKIVDQIMTVTSLGKAPIMQPDTAIPPSGYALRIHYIPMEAKAGKKVVVLQEAFRLLNKMIFEANKVLGKTDFGQPKTKLHFAHGLPVDENSRMQVDQGQIAMKTKSRWTAMEERAVEDIPAEMARIDEEQAKDRENELEFQKALAREVAVIQAAARPKPSA